MSDDVEPVPYDPDGAYEIVMPFVCVQSVGGPYDDDAFAAGARFGQDVAELAAQLDANPHLAEWGAWVYPPMVGQYDLLAMRHGFVMTAEPWEEHPDEWVGVTFRRPVEAP